MKRIHIIFGISLLVLLVALAVAYVKLADQTALLIIHFDKYQGIDMLGSKGDIFSCLLIGVGIVAVNGLLAYVLYRRDRFLANLLGYVSVAISVLLFLSTLAIISNN